MSEHTLVTFFMALFATTNPIGNLAIFLSMTADKSLAEQRRTAFLTMIAVMVTLVLTTWLGEEILSFFGISIGAFQTAGGIIILLIALSMLHSESSKMSHTDDEDEAAMSKNSVAVVPLAIPIFAGPGGLSTVVIATHQHPTITDKLWLTGVCLGLSALIGVLLYFATNIGKCLGVSGVKIATRVMGLILASIAVGMVADGIHRLFPAL